MPDKKTEPLWTLLGLLFRAHPWHGVTIGSEAPDVVTTYIEIVPTDTVKYELDKVTGILKVDRPQRYSNYCPMLYGLIPQTYCAEKVGALCSERTGRAGILGDGDPLDICVLTEKEIPHGDILMRARPIGGLRLIDGNQADDKIIASMEGISNWLPPHQCNPVGIFGGYHDLAECPAALIERLQHYFLTYKDPPLATTRRCELAGVYGAEEARHVIRQAVEDYNQHFEGIENMLTEALRG